ncbi:MAG: UvrD-helicase domain-containing protein [Turicibacter sp.]|nr:UvrD-helicase domain-containing protein [Turicibacter sp.]
MDYNLNPNQYEAVLHKEGPLLVFAGAGSGKTRVLTHRMAHLLESGVNPYNILAITFTNKAAREMKERVSILSQEGDRCLVATFHSACVRILRREIERLGYSTRFSIFDATDSERLIKDVVNELNLDEKFYPPKLVASVISTQKNELISVDEFYQISAGDFRMTHIADAYELYQQRLKTMHALDFDDIISRTVEVLEIPEVLEFYQNRFQYIMVDEYQDTNTAQYRFVSMLAGKRQNICAVGDDDQSIYGWRGANIKNILNFQKDFPNARIIKLEQNYRSTQTILDAANNVVGNNINRSEKILWSDKGKGDKITVYMADDDRDEANFIIKTIKSKITKGAKHSDFAILYRTTAQSRTVEDAFVMSGIPYRLYGGTRFYERMEIKDILAYLKILDNPADGISLERIVNVPRRKIGDISISRLKLYASERNISLFEAMQEVESIETMGKSATAQIGNFVQMLRNFIDFSLENTVSALMNKILDETGYIEYLQDGTFEAESRIENIQEFYNKTQEFGESVGEDALSMFLEEVALVSDIDNYEEGADTVSLMTLHSSKGLEFEEVFIVGFEENIFPSYRSLEGGAEKFEEERRLCYVGITRAKQSLYLTHARQRMYHGKIISNAISSFFKEIPEEFYELAHLKKPILSPRGVAKLNRDKKPINPYINKIPAPTDKELTFVVGDRVKHLKYGAGEVLEITPGGADYEVTVKFDRVGVKKIMAFFSKLALENKQD